MKDKVLELEETEASHTLGGWPVEQGKVMCRWEGSREGVNANMLSDISWLLFIIRVLFFDIVKENLSSLWEELKIECDRDLVWSMPIDYSKSDFVWSDDDVKFAEEKGVPLPRPVVWSHSWARLSASWLLFRLTAKIIIHTHNWEIYNTYTNTHTHKHPQPMHTLAFPHRPLDNLLDNFAYFMIKNKARAKGGGSQKVSVFWKTNS
jgi:hypothetical protein